ncbi:MarR family winged helix-turn-helix transcriptional regulator [Streptantibioticus ferralitis]|uniref:MarR family transcriptional regulator n=1 Tax=Streptantibioticus ferralitis TaxID=236510 RepID=A0ABT5YXH8_9ACTN|nr:MarR family transcriptional regulator [Streptantibioticus ferralitis]MDF2256188.1 MarR family transcriptional regulator [Streptantibioticus ferralitis]
MPDAAADACDADDATAALERVLLSLSYLLTRPQAHDRSVTKADVQIGRSDVHLLMALENDGGSCRVGDLAARLLVEPSHVTRQVAQLQLQGLVERTPDQTDRRARNITITPMGTSVLSRLRRSNRDSLHQALHDIDERDIDATVRVLRRLIERYVRQVRSGEPWHR